MTKPSRVISSLERDRVLRHLKEGKRIDGRDLMEYREIDIKTNISPKAEGSVDVHLGKSRVICGVKYDVGTPYPDNPDEGVTTVMSEFVPIASPMFEGGRPGEDAIQLARVVDRGIRHSNSVDKKKLCIKEGEHVYIIFIDNYVMDYYGNLTDCAAIASIAALLNAKLPGAKVEDGELKWDGTYGPIPINEIPLSITFGKIGEYIFVDPSLDEEMVADGMIAFATDEKGQITSIQKYDECTWTVDEIIDLSRKAIEFSNNLREKLNLRQYTPEF